MPGEIEITLAADEQELVFHALRGRAIQEFAALEQSMLRVLAALTGQQVREAAVVFFNIRNSNTLLNTFDGLMERRFGDRYLEIWKPLVKLIRHLTNERNCIVHYNVFLNISPEKEWTLRPADFYHVGKEPPRILRKSDIVSFVGKCNFANSICGFFSMAIAPNAVETWGQAQVDAWLDICRRVATYQDESSSLKSPRSATPESPPPSSPA
jgi:hypothetical protein